MIKNILKLNNKIIFLILPISALGAENSFQAVWSKIKANSPEMAQSRHLLRGAELANNRSGLHFLPSLNLQGSAYSTNDPSGVFFANLSQRQINNTDFNLSNLNEPKSQIYKTLGLGLDLPLYEGGAKQAQANFSSAALEDQNLALKERFINEYVAAVSQYGKLTSIQQVLVRINDLKTKVTQVLSAYSVGSESNPVGYSGLLGLKSIRNRIEGAIIEQNTDFESAQKSLAIKANIQPEEINVDKVSISEFLSHSYKSTDQEDGKSSEVVSISEKRALQQSLLAEYRASAEKGRYLPKVGLFANETMLNGDRDTGFSHTVGLYLQWSLFNPDHLNRQSEAHEFQLAAGEGARIQSQASKEAREKLDSNLSAIQKNYELLVESEKLLDEQSKTTTRLFRSGSISALQLAEVYNRRLDLILNLKTLEMNWIELKAQSVKVANFEGEFL